MASEEDLPLLEGREELPELLDEVVGQDAVDPWLVEGQAVVVSRVAALLPDRGLHLIYTEEGVKGNRRNSQSIAEQ